MRRVAALIAYVGKPTRDGRTIDEVTMESGKLVPVFDGRPGGENRIGLREMIGQAYISLDGEAGRDVVAHCTLYNDAAAALLAPESPYRLVADMRGEVVADDDDEYRIRTFTEPETRPYPKWKMRGEVGAVTLTHVPAWDDLWVREES